MHKIQNGTAPDVLNLRSQYFHEAKKKMLSI